MERQSCLNDQTLPFVTDTSVVINLPTIQNGASPASGSFFSPKFVERDAAPRLSCFEPALERCPALS